MQEKRILTIFLSSPFNGLRTERDVFINRYLPLLRGRAQKSGIHIKVIDLRWGISSADSEAHKTLWICLTNCKITDMFIGFYGGRYGSVYNPKDPQTAWVKQDFDYAKHNGFEWVTIYNNRSVTELEFRFGWLNRDMANPEANAYGLRPAAFWFRDPVYDAAMAKKEPENARHYVNQFKIHDEKLTQLKLDCAEIAPCVIYDNPTKVCQDFKDRCEEWMTHMLPETDTSKFGQENGAHFAFQAARTTMYINSNRDQVAEFSEMILSQSNNPLMLVEGGSGSGKSALIANFVKVHQAKADVEDQIITHYIGCSSDSTNIGMTLRRLIALLDGKEGVFDSLPEPEAVNELTKMFAAAVMAASQKISKKKNTLLLIILDGLSQLDKVRE